jgi:Mrp family chromosome partitioning ATPase
MDRIRKALDLAREQRSLSSDAVVDSPAELKKTLNTRAVTRLPAEVRYTTTRAFVPPPDLLESNRIIDVARSSPAASAFRMLRTQVLQRMQAHHWRSIAVVSPTADEGKTTTAINLAISLANDHRHTVLLVEFDLKRPSMAAMLGIAPASGADDVLRGSVGVEEGLYHPEGFDRLVVMPARAPMVDSSEALAGAHCRALVAELRERYPDRILVFDLPPVLGADDALAFAPLVECALVVVAEGLTRREDLLRCMELLSKTPVVGTVLNRATDVAPAYV